MVVLKIYIRFVFCSFGSAIPLINFVAVDTVIIMVGYIHTHPLHLQVSTWHDS